MQDIINLITNNGIGVVCVAYLIYFQNTTMKSMLDTLSTIDKRLLLIEEKIGKEVSTDETKQGRTTKKSK